MANVSKKVDPSLVRNSLVATPITSSLHYKLFHKVEALKFMSGGIRFETVDLTRNFEQPGVFSVILSGDFVEVVSRNDIVVNEGAEFMIFHSIGQIVKMSKIETVKKTPWLAVAAGFVSGYAVKSASDGN